MQQTMVCGAVSALAVAEEKELFLCNFASLFCDCRWQSRDFVNFWCGDHWNICRHWVGAQGFQKCTYWNIDILDDIRHFNCFIPAFNNDNMQTTLWKNDEEEILKGDNDHSSLSLFFQAQNRQSLTNPALQRGTADNTQRPQWNTSIHKHKCSCHTGRILWIYWHQPQGKQRCTGSMHCTSWLQLRFHSKDTVHRSPT